MDRWRGLLRVPVCCNGNAYCRVAASLCLSPISKKLIVPSANAIFFNGDRVDGSGNPVIERLSDLQKMAEVLVSKFHSHINVWIVEAPVFNGPFAIYKEFIPSVNCWGEPASYDPTGLPASTATVSLLLNGLQEVKNAIPDEHQQEEESVSPLLCEPKTILLGFSKGGTVVNQLVTELSCSEVQSTETQCLREAFLNSISEIHYVDAGLNRAGAYLTDGDAIQRISDRVVHGAGPLRFFLHGTPRQWGDGRRVWIRNEKDELVRLLLCEAQRSGGKLQVLEKCYFADKPPDLQMHFEIIEVLNV